MTANRSAETSTLTPTKEPNPVADLRVERAAVAASVNLPIYMRNPQDFASIDGLVGIIVI